MAQFELFEGDAEVNNKNIELLNQLSDEEIEDVLRFGKTTSFIQSLLKEDPSKKSLTDLEEAKVWLLFKNVQLTRKEIGSKLFDEEAVKNKYSFSAEYGIDNDVPDRYCRMAMVVYISNENHPVYASPFIAERGDGKDLDLFFNENFKFSDENKLFVYRFQGQWKVVGQKEEQFASHQDLLRAIWETHHPRKQKKQEDKAKKNPN